MSDDTMQSIADAITAFKRQFETADGKLLGEDAPVSTAK
jgi:F-type H+-transporting ATPase subunit alpha